MTSVVPTSPNSYVVKDGTGTVLGTVTVSALGFIAWSAAGRSLGGPKKATRTSAVAVNMPSHGGIGGARS